LRTTNQILIRAPWRAVFDAAARVERWPQLLPHYRRVQVLSGRGRRRVVDMAAHRDGFPCRWVSDQVLQPDRKKIYYRHIRSFWTQGMDVWWILKPRGPRQTEILLTHDMPSPRGFRGWFLQRVIGDRFVHNIAGKTLAGLKRHLETV
jgi:ribosome-associated toxin RatA of RatAB toxin-antitoxin module